MTSLLSSDSLQGLNSAFPAARFVEMNPRGGNTRQGMVAACE